MITFTDDRLCIKNNLGILQAPQQLKLENIFSMFLSCFHKCLCFMAIVAKLPELGRKEGRKCLYVCM